MIRRRLPGWTWTPKTCRSFVASLLRSSEQYHGSDVVDWYLSHAPASMTDRHYARPSQARMDAAVRWVGEQLGQV
jgi:hypothetical protein